jgi:hypothetical protein
VGYWVEQTADGGYIIAGESAGNVILVKTLADGTVDWEKSHGGTGAEIGYCVKPLSAGYVVVGTTTSEGAGGSDVYLLKTDDAGNELWHKAFGGTGDDTGREVCETAGGYVIAGSTNSSGAGNSDVYFIKTDAAGNMLQERTYGGADMDEGYAIDVHTGAHGYILAGRTRSFSNHMQVYVIKTDVDGNVH